jgi:hypothetical protein
MTCLLHKAKYLLGMSIVDQYSLVEASCKKWLKNENDLDNNKYELFILKYNVNHDALVE